MLVSEQIPRLEERFWASFPAPSREDAYDYEYTKLCQNWNESLAATQLFSQEPEAAKPLFMTKGSALRLLDGGGE